MMRIFLLLLLLVTGQAHAALTWFWRAEGTTLDGTHDLANGSGTVTLNAAASISATAALVGSNGLWANGSAHQAQIDSTTAMFSAGEGAIGFLVRATAWVGGTVIMSVGSAFNQQYGAKLGGSSGTGNVYCYVGDPDGPSAQAATTVGNLAANVTYGVICRWNHAANTLRVEVYSTPTGTPSLIEGVSNTGGYTQPTSLNATNGFRLGDMSGLGFTGYFDNVFVSKTYAEPIESNFSITSYTGYGGGGSGDVVVNPISGRGGAAAQPVITQ